MPSPRSPAPAGDEQSTQAAFGRILLDLSKGGGDLADRIVTTSPDVAVSTNLGAWVNQRGLFRRSDPPDVFAQAKVPSAQKWGATGQGQHMELGIAENNLVLMLAAAGLSDDLFGQRLIPIGTLSTTRSSRAGRGLVTFADAAAASLSWLGGVVGQRVAPLGVDRFRPDRYTCRVLRRLPPRRRSHFRRRSRNFTTVSDIKSFVYGLLILTSWTRKPRRNLDGYFGAPAHLRKAAPLALDAQARCDAIQAEFRAKPERRSIRRDPPAVAPALIPTDDMLKLRLAEELEFARRMIDQLGETLCGDPIVVGRHMVSLQAVDIGGQILSHIASVIRSSDPDGAVERIGMRDLKARLKRHSIG